MGIKKTGVRASKVTIFLAASFEGYIKVRFLHK